MEKMKLPNLPKNTDWGSEYCHLHKIIKNGVEQSNPIRMIIYNGKEVCPRCRTEESDKELKDKIQRDYDDMVSRKYYDVLFKRSILSDETIKSASFDTYLAENEEESTNKRQCISLVEEIKEGRQFNIFIQGNPGVGKTHLAYSILRRLNEGKEKTCLIANIEEMLRLIRNSIRNKESPYTEAYFIDLLSSVEYLALDDLGSETGEIATQKKASDFVHRILYAVTNARQNKVTICTTNLTSKQLFSIYDNKIMSRLLRNHKSVVFKTTKDKRLGKLPF